MDELRRRVDRGLTVVLATHNTALVSELCTHALLLRDGRVDAYGAPADVMPGYDVDAVAVADARARKATAVAHKQAVAAGPLAVRSAGVYDVAGNSLLFSARRTGRSSRSRSISTSP